MNLVDMFFYFYKKVDNIIERVYTLFKWLLPVGSNNTIKEMKKCLMP